MSQFAANARDELRALVAVETECCPWASRTVGRAAGEIVLDVHATAEGIATLHAKFAAALPPRRG